MILYAGSRSSVVGCPHPVTETVIVFVQPVLSSRSCGEAVEESKNPAPQRGWSLWRVAVLKLKCGHCTAIFLLGSNFGSFVICQVDQPDIDRSNMTALLEEFM